jgi:hypothetical protein
MVFVEYMIRLKTLLAIFLIVAAIIIIVNINLQIPGLGKPSLNITLINASASLLSDGRYFMLTVYNAGSEDVELYSIFINNSKVFTWMPSRTLLKPGENALIKVFFYWVKGRSYNVTLMARCSEGFVNSSCTVQTPIFSNVLEVDVTDVHAERIYEDIVKIDVKYVLKSIGYSRVYIRLFTFKNYTNTQLPIYTFYDYRYMLKDTINLIDAFVDEAEKHGLNIVKLNWELLERLVENRSRCILIIFSPLSSINIPILTGALPACIIDPNRSQGITDNSKYGKSLIYDWMRDNGLIFVTVGLRASQSNRWILYEDGYARRNLEKLDLKDACIFLTDAGKVVMERLDIYLPSRITETLGLHIWKGDLGFNMDEMSKIGVLFYSYANWRLKSGGEILNLSMPCFIRVGEGGWLCLDNTLYQQPQEAIISDLISIIQHSPWSKEWYPTGWMYDSSYTYESGHKISKSNVLTVTIPNPAGVEGKFMLVAVGYDEDSDSYTYITNYGGWSLK